MTDLRWEFLIALATANAKQLAANAEKLEANDKKLTLLHEHTAALTESIKRANSIRHDQ